MTSDTRSLIAEVLASHRDELCGPWPREAWLCTCGQWSLGVLLPALVDEDHRLHQADAILAALYGRPNDFLPVDRALAANEAGGGQKAITRQPDGECRKEWAIRGSAPNNLPWLTTHASEAEADKELASMERNYPALRPHATKAWRLVHTGPWRAA